MDFLQIAMYIITLFWAKYNSSVCGRCTKSGLEIGNNVYDLRADALLGLDGGSADVRGAI